MVTSPDTTISKAPTIASYSIQDPDHPEVELAQVEHRIRLVSLWDIQDGARVLELGCGQGNTTAVLAEAVGRTGHIDAVDPGALDYGAPFTLAQAQAHISASPVGSRVSWHQAAPTDFLASTGASWDVAVLAHCIWYFSSEQILAEILGALRGRVQRVCIAEYALHATERAALPHVLAVLARGALEALKTESSENVRAPLSPRAVAQTAERAGWTPVREATFVPDVGLLDGSWEVGAVVNGHFLEEINDVDADERARLVISSARDATVAAIEALKGGKVQTMDVWAAVFEPKD